MENLVVGGYISNGKTANSVIYQKGEENEDHVVMFISAMLKKHQRNYTTIKKRILALVNTLKKAQIWLMGKTINIPESMKTIINKMKDLAQIHIKAAYWLTIINSFQIKFTIKREKKKYFDPQPEELTLEANAVELTFTRQPVPKDLKRAFDELKIHQMYDEVIKQIRETLIHGEVDEQTRYRLRRKESDRKKDRNNKKEL